MRLFWGPAPPRSLLRLVPRSALAPLAVLGVVLMAACSTGQPSSSSSQDTSKLTVWVDAVRLPVAEAYAKAHPNLKLDIVTYDGDGNGATSLQTKIQLWNRTGNGWPDVVFSEQANDPVWMAQKPFEFAAPLNDPDKPFEHICFTVPWNMAENPAVSINGGYDEKGFPIGVQIIGRRFDDLGLLGMAKAFEGLRGPQRPWPSPPKK